MSLCVFLSWWFPRHIWCAFSGTWCPRLWAAAWHNMTPWWIFSDCGWLILVIPLIISHFTCPLTCLAGFSRDIFIGNTYEGEKIHFYTESFSMSTKLYKLLLNIKRTEATTLIWWWCDIFASIELCTSMFPVFLVQF